MKKRNEWNMSLFLEVYRGLALGKKKIEGRVPDFTKPEKDYRSMQVGDILNFFAIDSTTLKPIEDHPQIKYSVSFLHHYSSVKEMLKSEGLESFPGINSIKEGIQIYQDRKSVV